ncbi:WD40 repeat-like protein [Suillus decipiens]|nr:WD40 repeat-like protein [Suillus decipiens]
MASASTNVDDTKSILTSSMTLRGHRCNIQSMSYFPDGQRMISGSWDKTTRRWDLKAGKEIKGAQGICEGKVYAVAVSMDGRWVVTGGGDYDHGELKVCEAETGIIKTFVGHSKKISCIDISADSMLLASGSRDGTARIWNLETGDLKLIAGPFGGVGWVGAVRFSTDSKKLAVKLDTGDCLEVWEVQSQKSVVRIGRPLGYSSVAFAPVFWTNKNKTIIAALTLASKDDDAKTVHEFDALTLKNVGTPFEGHTKLVTGLALSLDGALLASAARDDTIKLWAYESRQLLASFDIQNIHRLILSPDSCQLAYTINTKDVHKICICATPPDILAQASAATCKRSEL